MEIFLKVLYALPVYQSVILFLFLVAGSINRKSYSLMLMGIFQLLMAIYFTFNFLYSIREFNLVRYLYFFILPVILMFIPIFYIYIISITKLNFKFLKSYIFHFIPAILIALLNVPYLFASYPEKYEFISHGYNSININSLFSYLLFIYMFGILGIFTLQLLLYSVKAIQLYKKHRTNIENRYSYTENIDLNWILVLIFCFVIFFIFNDILYLIGFRQQLFTQVIYNLSMLITTLYIGYRGLIQVEMNENKLLTNIVNINQDNIEQSNINLNTSYISLNYHAKNTDYMHDTSITKQENIKKYIGSALSDEQKKILLIKLQSLIQYEKIFINEKLSLEDVAIRLNTNTKYISQIINETYNKNFYNFINTYRVDEAKKLLKSAENEKFSILGIAQSVGFVSKSAFNVAFKRFTGLTPSDYKNSNTGID